MNHRPIILDACTIINLLRIDENELLYKQIQTLNIKIAECVYNEVINNIFKNNISNNDRVRIKQQLPVLRQYITSDKDIKKDIGTNEFELLKQTTKHSAENGELYSLFLSLILSRSLSTQSNFYTDDKPAKERFEPYFMLQQLGLFGDTADLILFLYWYSSNISEHDLKRILDNLKSEYNRMLKNFVVELENKRSKTASNRRNKKLNQILDKIINGFYNGDRDIMQKEFENLIFISDKEIKQIIKKYNPDIFKTSHIIDKIDQIQSLLVKHKIFKIA